jgi:hypothetical protein
LGHTGFDIQANHEGEVEVARDEPRKSPRQEAFGPGRGPQALAQLQATGAQVFGSDGEKVGDLKEVYGSNFSVGRGLLKKDLYVPVRHIQEITGDEDIVLDVPAGRVDEMDWDRSRGYPNPPASSADSAEVEKGTWEIRREDI